MCIRDSCTSTNHIVCHGIPSDKILKEGDIVNVDVTAIKDGWHGDTSRTFKVGEVSVKAEKLINVTYESMMKAINILENKDLEWSESVLPSISNDEVLIKLQQLQ